MISSVLSLGSSFRLLHTLHFIYIRNLCLDVLDSSHKAQRPFHQRLNVDLSCFVQWPIKVRFVQVPKTWKLILDQAEPPNLCYLFMNQLLKRDKIVSFLAMPSVGEFPNTWPKLKTKDQWRICIAIIRYTKSISMIIWPRPLSNAMSSMFFPGFLFIVSRLRLGRETQRWLAYRRIYLF